MGKDDLVFSREPLGTEMAAAAEGLSRELADRNRLHLNAVAEAVFLSHAGHPVMDVLEELVGRSETELYKPDAETLLPAAQAISRGRRFGFV
jgi:hypothetical protein